MKLIIYVITKKYHQFPQKIWSYRNNEFKMANRDFFLAKKEIHGFYGIVAVGHNVLKKKTTFILKALTLLNPDLASFSKSNGNFSNYDFYKLKTFFVHFCPGFTSTPLDYTPSLEMHLPSLKNAFS